jgi:cell division protein FtsQ
MLKKILGLLVVLGVISYLIFAIVQFSGKVETQSCSDVEVQVMELNGKALVGEPEVLTILQLNHLKLVGQRLEKINYRRVEKVVSALKMVSRVESFYTNSGKVVIRIWQNEPILRIQEESGSYYVGTDGKPLGISFHSSADVLVASGSNLDSAQVARLYKFALVLQKDTFWNAQVEQLYVEPNGEWTLIPRIGSHEVLLGLPNNLEDKLFRLKLFYEKALPKVGWERYSKISLKFRNQIVCTLKEE